MKKKLLEYIEIDSAEGIEYAVIWLHGLGASGHDFEPIIPELHLLGRPGIRFLFPHAPIRPISVNGGAAMRAWYNITSLEFDSRQHDYKGIQESVDQIADLVDMQIDLGIPASNILLAGFSQGGVIALQAGYTLKHRIAGVLALSTYLPMDEAAVANISDDKLDMPVFMAHGLYDTVININYARTSRDLLLARQCAVEWHKYPIAHSLSSDEVNDIAIWLRRQFGM